jgi:hypothetical protein
VEKVIQVENTTQRHRKIDHQKSCKASPEWNPACHNVQPTKLSVSKRKYFKPP